MSTLQVLSVLVLLASLRVAIGESSGVPDAVNSSAPAIASAALLAPGVLESHGTQIGTISIVNDNIFDIDDPEESRVLHRFANALHIKTKPDIIRTQLLLESGDLYTEQRVEETERLLRSNRYLRDATITPVGLTNGVVDLEVRTSDVWTLSPSLSLSRSGGTNAGGFGLKEYNLLGTGSTIGVAYKSDVDRDSLTLKFLDRNILSSRYQLLAQYSDASDGFIKRFALNKPFFSLDTRRAGGVILEDGRRTESLYDSGEIATQYEHSFARHETYVGWSAGLKNNWSRRFVTGVGVDSHQYAPAPDDLYPDIPLPDDRKFVYPFVGVEFLQDDYETTRNLDQMNRTEDRHLGLRAAFRIGYAAQSIGSTADAWIYQGDLANTLLRSKKNTLVLSAGLSGRVESGQARNTLGLVSARFDRRQSESRLLHISLSATAGDKLDLENTIYLGGDSGLRGYPLRYQAGDSSALFTIEQRLFTDWNPFRLVDVGAAVFFDAGRTWGHDPVQGTNYGWLKNVGIGLRLGSSRSGIGSMMHIDLAYPLDGGDDISKVQLLVQAKRGF